MAKSNLLEATARPGSISKHFEPVDFSLPLIPPSHSSSREDELQLPVEPRSLTLSNLACVRRRDNISPHTLIAKLQGVKPSKESSVLRDNRLAAL